MTRPSVSSLPSRRMKLVVRPGWPFEKTGFGPPRRASIRTIVSSIRNRVEFSRNDSVGGGKMGTLLTCTVRNGASPLAGKPRTNTLAPETPPELSAQTPGTSLNRSAVLFGENLLISSLLVVVIAKLASNFLSSAPPATPVTMISSIVPYSASGSSSWAAAGVASDRAVRNADASASGRHFDTLVVIFLPWRLDFRDYRTPD